MKRFLVIVVMLAACGGASVESTKSGVGSPNLDPNLMLLGTRCTGAVVAETGCPFQAQLGNCFHSWPQGSDICGVPCSATATDGKTVNNCPAGSSCGTLLNVALCLKECIFDADCGPGTTCSQTSAFPGQTMTVALCNPNP